MARKRNRSRHVPKRPVAIPGILEQPVSGRELIVPIVVDLVKTYSMLGIMLITFVVGQIHFIPVMYWGTSRERLLSMAYCLVAAFFSWLGYKSTDELYKLSQAVPLERMDFRYVAPRRNRMLLWGTVSSILYLLPVLYVSGVITSVASAINTHLTQNQQLAKTLAWLSTAAMTGIIGNLATNLIGRIAGVIFRRKQKE